MYIPELKRIGHVTVSVWRRDSFQVCKGISADTPVNYSEPNDLAMAPTTAALVPRNFTTRETGRGAVDTREETEGEENTAESLRQAVLSLDNYGEEQVVESAVRERREAWATCEEASGNADGAIEVVYVGTEAARAAVGHTTTITFASVEEAMKLPHWPLIKTAMEEEIAGKLANNFAEVVKDTGQRRSKVKWVLLVYLAEDGSVLKVKARLVLCGYSQVKDRDFTKCEAPTLPGPEYRLFASMW